MSNGDQAIVIRLENVDKFFGDFQALKGINLSVKKGERIFVCGPAGAGKSTLIRCINRLEQHNGGTIVINGRELPAVRRPQVDQRRQEYVDQQRHASRHGAGRPALGQRPSHMTVIKHLMLTPQLMRKSSEAEARDTAMKYLERVKIPELADKYPSQLTRYQEQRLTVARALCMNPDIMLFDVMANISEMSDVMTDLARDGMTMIITNSQRVNGLNVTEMRFACSLADNMVFMDNGEIVEITPPAEFFDNPKSEQAKLFLET